jgi:hypothetical protein
VLQRRTACSEKLSELDGVHERDGGLAGVDDVLSTRLHGNALGVNLDTLGLGLSLELVVGADTVDKGLAGLGLANVFNADVNTLRDDASVDALVDDYTD